MQITWDKRRGMGAMFRLAKIALRGDVKVVAAYGLGGFIVRYHFRRVDNNTRHTTQ